MEDAALDVGGYYSDVEIYYRMVGDVRLFGLIGGTPWGLLVDTAGVVGDTARVSNTLLESRGSILHSYCQKRL